MRENQLKIVSMKTPFYPNHDHIQLSLRHLERIMNSSNEYEMVKVEPIFIEKN